MEDSSLKYLGVVGNHESNLLYFGFVFGLVDLDFVKRVGCLKDSFLHGSQHFLDYLSDFGLHLEPLELFDFELGVLGHFDL